MDPKVPKNAKSQADELEERLIDFAVRIVKLSAHLPRTPAGKHIAGQILRSGTSPAPNYGEARGAESTADFIHKVRIVLKETERNLHLVACDSAFKYAEKRTYSRHHWREQRVVPNIR